MKAYRTLPEDRPDWSFIPVTPKKPAECKRHRWSQRINLATGEMLDGSACWHCGTPEPTDD